MSSDEKTQKPEEGEVARWMQELETCLDQNKDLRMQLAQAESKIKAMDKQDVTVREQIQLVLEGSRPLESLGKFVSASEVTHHRSKLETLERELSQARKDMSTTATILAETERKLIDTLGRPSFEAWIGMIKKQCLLLPITLQKRLRVEAFASKLVAIKNSMSESDAVDLVSMISDDIQFTSKSTQTKPPPAKKVNGCSARPLIQLFCLHCGSGPYSWCENGRNECEDCGELLQRTGSELLLWQQHTSNWLRKMISLRQRSPFTLSKMEAILEKPRPRTPPISCKTGVVLKKNNSPALPSHIYSSAPSLSLVGVPNNWCRCDIGSRAQNSVMPAFGNHPIAKVPASGGKSPSVETIPTTHTISVIGSPASKVW